jgi:hypothetical protein
MGRICYCSAYLTMAQYESIDPIVNMSLSRSVYTQTANNISGRSGKVTKTTHARPTELREQTCVFPQQFDCVNLFLKNITVRSPALKEVVL